MKNCPGGFRIFSQIFAALSQIPPRFSQCFTAFAGRRRLSLLFADVCRFSLSFRHSAAVRALIRNRAVPGSIPCPRCFSIARLLNRKVRLLGLLPWKGMERWSPTIRPIKDQTSADFIDGKLIGHSEFIPSGWGPGVFIQLGF